jgi:hypothetical protein
MAEQKAPAKKTAAKEYEIALAKGVVRIKGEKFKKGDKVKLGAEEAKALVEKGIVK